MERHLVISGDGSHTLFVPDLGEHYHSLHGAVQESMHVFIREGLLYSRLREAEVFEVGFGTGLNALLTLKSVMEQGISVRYFSLEKYPLRREEWSRLNYAEIFPAMMKGIPAVIHECPWNEDCEIYPGFILHKIRADLKTYTFNISPNLVYFDAFSPDVQPGLWSPEIFAGIYSAMRPGGILTTYSAKGSIRRILEACGFRTEKVKGPPGKREMLRAAK